MTPAELRRIAEAATKGPWEAFKDANEFPADFGPIYEWLIVNDDEDIILDWSNGTRREDAEFIATFNPQRVLELLDERVRLESVIREQARLLDGRATRLASIEKLHGKYTIYDTAFACADRTERHSQEAHMEVDGFIVCTDLPLYAVCARCRDEEGFHTINWPCPTIKAIKENPVTGLEWSERIDQAIKEYPEVGEYLEAIRGNIEALARRLKAVEELAEVYDRCPDELDAQEAASDILKAVRGE